MLFLHRCIQAQNVFRVYPRVVSLDATWGLVDADEDLKQVRRDGVNREIQSAFVV